MRNNFDLRASAPCVPRPDPPSRYRPVPRSAGARLSGVSSWPFPHRVGGRTRYHVALAGEALLASGRPSERL
jgi:hypothetical protein